MTSSMQRFTLDGCDALEARLRRIVGEVAAAVREEAPAGAVRALVLVGGYGRGEGGVEVRDGVEVPHNNLDFVLITRRGSPSAIRALVDPRLQALARREGIGIDVAAFSALGLRHVEPLVLWVDMRHGHRTVLGDEGFVPSLRRLEVSRIRPWDVRNLLVNRATLLLLNDLLMARGPLSPDERRLIVRHLVKAIVGAGDALLFFEGAYDPSYVLKQRRMREVASVPERLRLLYDEALHFRFRPRYESWLHVDLAALATEVRDLVSAAHRHVEERRLGVALPGWDDYLEKALRHVLVEDPASPRALARKLRNAARGAAPAVPGLSAAARAGLLAAGPRGRLPLLFPAVAYDDAPRALREQAAALLETKPARPALARAYLQAWSAHVDGNFAHVAARHHLVEEVPA